MKTVKVIKVGGGQIDFSDGTTLSSEHVRDCCENHYLSFSDITIDDFDGLEFELSSDNFFRRIEDYGIELIPVNGHSIKIPGYGSNNGYYSSNLSLVLENKDKGMMTQFNIDNCQYITE